ncbi:MAG: helix-hairpin-helix domain-containing protein [Lachnospiraceae bacterium]|nr:helix-hairpin-helix domain-containing protein [Lachnospiraceae bacterium]
MKREKIITACIVVVMIIIAGISYFKLFPGKSVKNDEKSSSFDTFSADYSDLNASEGGSETVNQGDNKDSDNQKTNSYTDSSYEGNASSGFKESDYSTSYNIKVYVCGAVVYPDVYELSSDSRIGDAINAAGGFKKNAHKKTINLAEVVTDGQEIRILTRKQFKKQKKEIEEASESSDITEESTGTSANSSSSVDKININTADKAELTNIPGIGDAKADAIISYRDTNGKFNTIEDIMNITGIKDGVFNSIKDYICV